LSRMQGSKLVLRNGADTVVMDADGPFAFPVDDGAMYDITIDTQPTMPNQTCVVSNGSGTVSGSDVTGEVVEVPPPAAAPAAPLYGGGPTIAWNTYVANDGADGFSASGTPCTGNESGMINACIHASELIAVTVDGVISCAGLTASDTLGAFEWRRVTTVPYVRMVSTRLAPGSP